MGIYYLYTWIVWDECPRSNLPDILPRIRKIPANTESLVLNILQNASISPQHILEDSFVNLNFSNDFAKSHQKSWRDGFLLWMGEIHFAPL